MNSGMMQNIPHTSSTKQQNYQMSCLSQKI